MKIIFNSDILYSKWLIQGELPRHIANFFSSCKVANHEVIIPLTTLFEFDSKQKKHLHDEINSLKNAIAKLNRYGLITSPPNPSELLNSPDLISLINEIGIHCYLEEPTLEDYSIAHRKACTRENPHPPEGDSDEMRDLVIWEMSLRIARDNGGAILMSQDKVHVHHRGDEEAKEYKLIRCISFERGLDSLSIDTFSAKKIKHLIDNTMCNIIQSELPIVKAGNVISVKNPVFYNTNQGSSVVTCNVEFTSGDGKNITSFLKMKYVNDLPFFLKFSNIIIHEKKKRTKHPDVMPELTPPELSSCVHDSKIDDLKKIIEG